MAKMDPKLVASKQAYEVSYFARKHGITTETARGLLKEAGPSREKANGLATKKKKK